MLDAVKTSREICPETPPQEHRPLRWWHFAIIFAYVWGIPAALLIVLAIQHYLATH